MHYGEGATRETPLLELDNKRTRHIMDDVAAWGGASHMVGDSRPWCDHDQQESRLLHRHAAGVVPRAGGCWSKLARTRVEGRERARVAMSGIFPPRLGHTPVGLLRCPTHLSQMLLQYTNLVISSEPSLYACCFKTATGASSRSVVPRLASASPQRPPGSTSYYGRGCYFAETPRYALHYAHRRDGDPQGVRQVLGVAQHSILGSLRSSSKSYWRLIGGRLGPRDSRYETTSRLRENHSLQQFRSNIHESAAQFGQIWPESGQWPTFWPRVTRLVCPNLGSHWPM